MGVLGLLPWGGAGWRKVPGIPPTTSGQGGWPSLRHDCNTQDCSYSNERKPCQSHWKALGPPELHLVLTGKQQSGEQGCLWGSASPRRTENTTLQSCGDSTARPLWASLLRTRTLIFRERFSSLSPMCHRGTGVRTVAQHQCTASPPTGRRAEGQQGEPDNST